MADISDFARLVGLDGGLSVLTTLRRERTMQASVVNAGVVPHPVGGTAVVGFVADGGTRKLVNLRAYRQATVVIRAGSERVAAEGPIELIGPEDQLAGTEAEALRVLLRNLFAAAGGTQDDWDVYHMVTADERRCAVLVTPERSYFNAIAYKARFEDGRGSNSEQFIAAAHAAWFSMALSSILAQAGSPPDSIHTDASVTLRLVDGTPTVTKIALVTVGPVRGIDDATFAEQARATKAGCPGSKALVGVPEITLEASPAT